MITPQIFSAQCHSTESRITASLIIIININSFDPDCSFLWKQVNTGPLELGWVPPSPCLFGLHMRGFRKVCGLLCSWLVALLTIRAWLEWNQWHRPTWRTNENLVHYVKKKIMVAIIFFTLEQTYGCFLLVSFTNWWAWILKTQKRTDNIQLITQWAVGERGIVRLSWSWRILRIELHDGFRGEWSDVDRRSTTQLGAAATESWKSSATWAWHLSFLLPALLTISASLEWNQCDHPTWRTN